MYSVRRLTSKGSLKLLFKELKAISWYIICIGEIWRTGKNLIIKLDIGYEIKIIQAYASLAGDDEEVEKFYEHFEAAIGIAQHSVLF